MSYVTIEESDDERSIVTPDCRLVFRLDGGRWTHRIEVGEGSRRAVFAQAVEPDPERDDYRLVASPTFQDLHFQPESDRVYALLVGQYGPRHFSASFCVSDGNNGGSGADRGTYSHTLIQVDVAERCRERIDILASTYLVPSSGFTYRDGGSWVVNEVERAKDVFLSPDGIQEPVAQLVLDEWNARNLRAQIFRLLPPTQPNNRLIYRWRIQDVTPDR